MGEGSSTNSEMALIPIGQTTNNFGILPKYQLPMDTFEWVQTLSSEGSLSREQCEALIDVCQDLAALRLANWNASQVASPRLHQDLQLIRALTYDLSTSDPPSASPLVSAIHFEREQRARYDRLQTELHLVTEQLRDLVTAVRTDLALVVNGYKGESKEDGQRMELELHKLEARLVAASANFKSQAENVKLRSLYTFASTSPSFCVY